MYTIADIANISQFISREAYVSCSTKLAIITAEKLFLSSSESVCLQHVNMAGSLIEKTWKKESSPAAESVSTEWRALGDKEKKKPAFFSQAMTGNGPF